MPQMNIRRRRIDTKLYAKRLTRFGRALELCSQIFLPDHVNRAVSQAV
jgi:hypothetical protein